MAGLQNPQFPVDIPEDPGHGGLAGTGIPGEDAVIGDGGHLEPLLLAGLDDLGVIYEFVDLGLDLLQSDHAVQFGQSLFEGPFGLLSGFLRHVGTDGGSSAFLPGIVFLLRGSSRLPRFGPRFGGVDLYGRQEAQQNGKDPGAAPGEPLVVFEPLDCEGDHRTHQTEEEGVSHGAARRFFRQNEKNDDGHEEEKTASDPGIFHERALLFERVLNYCFRRE